MAATKAIRGKNTALKYKENSQWVSIAEITDIDGGDKSRNELELGPRLDGPDFVEAIVTDEKQADFTAVINYEKGQRDDLEALDDGLEHDWLLVYPDGATESFPGAISKLGMGKIAPNQKMTCSLSIKPYAKSVFTPAGVES